MIEVMDPLRDRRWAELAERRGGGLFQSVPWAAAVAEAYGFGMEAAVVMEGGRPVAGVLYSVLDDCVGKRVVSLPFTDVCDPFAGSGREMGELLAHLQGFGVPVHLRAMECEAAKSAGVAVAKRARWHRLRVESAEGVWQGMAPAMRRGVRKAEREGVTVAPLEGPDACERFLALHAGVRKRKYRLLAQPRAFFEAIRGQFEPLGGWLPLGAFHEGRLIAATLYLRWGNVLYYKFNASAEAGLAMRPNNLLVWEGAKMAAALGCGVMDLGPSDDDQPGLIRFKQDSGAEAGEVQFLRWTPPGWSDGRGPGVKRLLGELTGLLTEAGVPDEISVRAGALLYRYFA